MVEELVIDESNFDQYFFDARRNRPKKGQILAKYTANAELREGRLKTDLLSLLKTDKAKTATQVLNKLGGARYPDNIRVCREILEDLLLGLPEEEIIKKPYKYVLEQLFYTERQNVPQNDPHWSTIELLFDRKELEEQLKNIKEKQVDEDI